MEVELECGKKRWKMAFKCGSGALVEPGGAGNTWLAPHHGQQQGTVQVEPQGQFWKGVSGRGGERGAVTAVCAVLETRGPS